jgi:poly-gamma-glutamate synthesis protein (capsule biosynthesis protein)
MPIFAARNHRLMFVLALAMGSACAAGASSDSAPREVSARPEPDTPPPADPPAEAPVAEDPPPRPAALPPRELPPDYLTFAHACDPGDVVTIAAVGDIMGHHELQMQAYAAKTRFLDIWSNITDLLQRADITYANLEAPLARGITRKLELAEDPGMVFDNSVYSGYAMFNVHKSLAADLRKSGVDIVSVANNHSLDRGSLGIDHTLEHLDEAKVAHTGTRRKGKQEPWHAVTQTRGLRIAWLSCTLHTNFGKDEHGQVLYCFKGDKVRKLVEKLAADPKIDAVIVTPHWGKEYKDEPSDGQKKYAQEWVDAGATAVIGSHPHVLEPWTKLQSKDGREAFVIYSLGNFMSHQRTLNRRTSMVLYFGLRKGEDGEVDVVGARYVPLHTRMVGNKKKFFVEAIDRVGGPAEARAHALGMYGRWNLLPPDDELVVNPHCDPKWEFPAQ